MPHGRGDPWLLHGRRHRALAGLPLSAGVQRRFHPHRPARNQAGHLPRLGWQRAPAAPDRRAGGDGPDAHRPYRLGQRCARAGPGRQGRGQGRADRQRRGPGAQGRRAPVQAARHGLAQQHPARPQAAGAADDPAGRAQGAQGALSGAVCADRHLGALWRQGRQCAPGCRASRSGQAGRHADRAQPDPDLLPDRAPQGPGRKRGRRHAAAGDQAGARDRCRGDGRRHRRLVGLQGLRGDPAGSRAALHRPCPGPRPGAVREEGQGPGQASGGGRAPEVGPGRHRCGKRGPGDRGDHRRPRSQARALRRSRATAQAGCAADHQYLLDPAGGAAHPHRPTRAVRRPALLQSGGDDAAGGSGPPRWHVG